MGLWLTSPVVALSPEEKFLAERSIVVGQCSPCSVIWKKRPQLIGSKPEGSFGGFCGIGWRGYKWLVFSFRDRTGVGYLSLIRTSRSLTKRCLRQKQQAEQGQKAQQDTASRNALAVIRLLKFTHTVRALSLPVFPCVWG